MRVAISTGGGDAPGLNAVIRAAVLTGVRRGWEMFGIERGFSGLLGQARVLPLDANAVRGITHLGGTILGTTNRGNPFKWPSPAEGSENVAEVDRSDELIEEFRRWQLDAAIVVGGDGTMGIALELGRKGLPVVGVPKTIDNDVGGTLVTFGFDTALTTATEAIDKLHSTAESHDRVMVVEVMGRYAGWIALNAGVAATADAILIPEIPFDLERVAAKIRERAEAGRHFSIVVVAEGAVPKEGGLSIKTPSQAGAAERLGGIGDKVATALEFLTKKETRSLTLGHLQRGGGPTTFDRLLALRFGAQAVRTVAEGRFGRMVCYQPPDVGTVPLEDAVEKPKRVPLDSDTICTARELGISLGD